MRTYLTSSRASSAATARAASLCRSSKVASACGCWLSSASSHDSGHTSADDAGDVEPVVENDDVRASARLEHAEIGTAEDAGRHFRRRGDGLLEGDAERVQVAYRVEHR